MEKSFGNLIRKARKDKGYSQRELAKHLGVDFTYLSKLENDHADYAPKEEVIRRLAKNLIPQQYEEILKQNPREMLVLFQRMQENPEFAQEISQATRENEQ